MKDSRFIELLNLYVDREIAPEDAAALEAEVHRSAARRQLYEQYCRMDRGCTVLLAQNPAAPAPKLAAALAAADRKVVEFPEHTGGRSKLVLFGGLMAAAAAVAIVFVNRDSTPTAIPSAPQAQATVAVAPTAPIPTGREAVVALPLGGNMASVSTDSVNLAWMRVLELPRTAPLSEADLLLAARPEKTFSDGLTWGLRHENSTFQKGGATRPPTELNAYEVGK
jgi:hypothetical protein